MTTKYNVGDLVKIVPSTSNIQHVERFSTFDYLMTFVVVQNVNQEKLGTIGIRPEGSIGESALHVLVERVEPFGVWAEHQKPVPADKADDINKAIQVDKNGKPANGYLAACQRAWDTYAESRRKNNIPIIRVELVRKNFEQVYAMGYENGLQKHKAAVFAAQNLTPLSRAGEKAPAISKEKTGKLGDLVLMSLQAEGPGTAQEVADRIGEPLNAVSPRFATLKRRGLIHVSSGQRVGRGTRSVYSIGGGPL